MPQQQLLKMYSQSNYMVVNRDLAKRIGLTNSIVFGQLCSLQDSLGEWFYFTQDRLADACCISVATIKRSLTELRRDGYIQTVRKGTPCKTLYSIQWSNLIAQNELTSEVKMSQLDSSEWPNKISNKQSTNKVSNKNTKAKLFDDVFKELEVSDNLKKSLTDFIEMRKSIKSPMTVRALELSIKKLRTLSNLETTQISIVEQSIMNSWRGLFELKETKQTVMQRNHDFGNDEEWDRVEAAEEAKQNAKLL